VTNGLIQTSLITMLYTLLIFLIAWYAHYRKENGRSMVANPYIYTLSIAVYCTAWTFYGSVGKAATTGIDYLPIYLGPSLTAFAWIFLLRRMIRISKENNVTSIADFISLRYGKSPWLGALVTVLAILGIMPYIALQIKAVSTSFHLLCGNVFPPDSIPFSRAAYGASLPSGLLLTLILSLFAAIFGARRLVSSERHEGLIAAIALESVVKLVCLLGVGIFVTYCLNDGFVDIFMKFRQFNPVDFNRLMTIGASRFPGDTVPPFTMLFMSMGAIMLYPRQFHVMVIENSTERHIERAMWLFPLYLFLINLFIIPIALSGIMITGTADNADFFVLNIPLLTGHRTIATLAYLGGLAASAGMVVVESITISTMLLNYIFMPVIVRLKPRSWFPHLLINLKRFGIFLVIFLGYLYYLFAGNAFTLFKLGMFSFSAIIQFMPAVLGGVYWKRANRTGAIIGILSGLITWLYTLFLPSLGNVRGIRLDALNNGPFNISLLKPTALFGLTGMDPWSHCLFWSMLFNIGGYIAFSILLTQDEQERNHVRKFIGTFETERRKRLHGETSRLSKPVTITQFTSLLAKFIGDQEAEHAINGYIGNRSIDKGGHISEFELPNLKRFTEKTLAGSVGAAAAGAIVDSYLSDMGSRMELVYDIFSNVRSSLDQSREALFVRLKASEIINRTLDLRIIMDDLLELLMREFKLDLAMIFLRDNQGNLTLASARDREDNAAPAGQWLNECRDVCEMVANRGKSYVINDTSTDIQAEAFRFDFLARAVSYAYIPILREGEKSPGILAVFSNAIPGLFTEEFIGLLESLAGQLAQAIAITREIEAKERERTQKEHALMQNARIRRDMEIAQQIQLSLLPAAPPQLFGVELEGRCISAAHVGGDYYDFFRRDDNTVDILIADVSGHSVGAALIMAEARTLLKPQINSSHSACAILKLLNNQLYDDLTRAELFITMFYAQYNSATGRLSYANAGHNRPLVCREGEGDCIQLDAEGLIIGVRPTVVFEERSIELVRGDVVLFYTDGLIEATNPGGEQFGIQRICSRLREFRDLTAKEIIDSLYSSVSEYTGLGAYQDDISLVILKIL